MKKFITAVSLTLAVTGFAGLANAETWSPTGAVALFNVGNISVFKGINLTCGLSGSGNINGADASVGSLALTGFLCSTISFNGLPYNIEGNTGGTVTLEGVVVVGITGDCAGDLIGTFDQATGILTFDAAEIPSSPPGGAPCQITGAVGTNPQASYTNP
ncbi:hypothetical protein [uncultured Microbulbifer sp.]|uniref:hypothetical protein n=1 Tax=uncultured Microbulbifer sp. TaxID=348147 RepID=UPI00261084DF|nr:hypothetical protein [uncultured Microbulbifer sp.]